MAKARTVLSSSMDKHGLLAAQQAEAWANQNNERLEVRYPLAELKPSLKNPRRISLDRAGVTVEKVKELAKRDGEDVAEWLDRLELFLEPLRLSSPSAEEVWSDLIDLALSILSGELLQPIVANQDGVIIAGERRWTACMLASIMFNRVIVRRMSSVSETVSRFIENVQRSDLSLPETVSGLRNVLAELTGEKCGPDNKGVNIKAVRELVGKGATQSAIYRTFCRLPDDDPVLKRILSGGYSDKEMAYEDAKERLKHFRNLKAGITDKPVGDVSDESGSEIEKPGRVKSGSRTPAIKARLPGTEGGKVFLAAVASIPELPAPVMDQITNVQEQWTGAPDKVRKNMMTRLLDTLFNELDKMDELDEQDQEMAGTQ